MINSLRLRYGDDGQAHLIGMGDPRTTAGRMHTVFSALGGATVADLMGPRNEDIREALRVMLWSWVADGTPLAPAGAAAATDGDDNA